MNFRDVPIGSAFDVQNGATPASGEPSYWDGDTPWVSPADLGKLNTRFIENGERSITQDGYASCGTQMVPVGSIILSIRAPIGHIAIASNSMCFNQGCRGLVPRSMIRSDFSYWALVACRPKLEAAGQGTTFIELSRDKLRSERIPIPVHETQRAIADFLDRETARIDQLIEKKQRMVEVLGEKRQAVISHAVTKGLDPDVPMKDSGVEWLEEIPQHWETIPLKWRATCSSGNRIATDEVLPVPIPEQLTTVPVIGGNGRMGHSIESNIQVTVLAIGRVGAHCGNIHIVSPPAWITDNALVLRVDRTTFELRYLADVLRFRNLNALAERSAQPLITGTQVRDQRLPCPPLPEQSAIAAFLDREIAKINGLNTSIRKTIDRLREFRSALITAAVTGQINVSTWGKQGTTERRLDQIEEAAST